MLPSVATLCACLAVCTVVTNGADTKSLAHVDEYRYDFVRLEQDLWNTVIDEQSNSIAGRGRPEVDLIRSYQLFGDALDGAVPGDISDGVKPLEGVWIYARAYSELRGVYALYETFRRFQRLQVEPGRVPSPKQAWTDLAETILTDGKSSIPSALVQINKLITEENLFKESLKEIVFKHCDLNQSPDQVLYNLYNSVAWTELKGYAMIQFSLQLFKLFNNKGNFTNQATLMRHKYQERAQQTADAARAAMQKANRQLWKCDPKFHIRDQTYTELTRLLQGYIENEIDLSSSQSCMKNCAYYDFAQNNGCYKNAYCSRQQKCRGKLINCQYFDSDMWVCPADRSSGRRYEYIEYENGRVLGRKMGCYRGTTKVDSWWRYLFWHCSYCMCICDDAEDSDRYFNLREYVTDTENNRVVTGLKFVKKNRIVHLQLQEGELLPYGKINASTVHWRPVDAYKLYDRTVASGHDYHTLSWQKRDLDLDDVMLPAQHVLTGVRFRLVGTHLNLEIQATPFNFSSGTLVQPRMKSYWHSNDDEPVKRSKLRLVNPDVPTRSPQGSTLDSTSGLYVEFTYSDMDRDAAQTTLPFIDLQAVQSELPVPLSGAGVYHKGNRGFGGFVAPKLITYDYQRHIGVEFPPEIAADVPDEHDLGFGEMLVN